MSDDYHSLKTLCCTCKTQLLRGPENYLKAESGSHLYAYSVLWCLCNPISFNANISGERHHLSWVRSLSSCTWWWKKGRTTQKSDVWMADMSTFRMSYWFLYSLVLKWNNCVYSTCPFSKHFKPYCWWRPPKPLYGACPATFHSLTNMREKVN